MRLYRGIDMAAFHFPHRRRHTTDLPYLPPAIVEPSNQKLQIAKQAFQANSLSLISLLELFSRTMRRTPGAWAKFSIKQYLMKKNVTLPGLLMAVSVAFTACTKDLKDDISNLKKEMDSLTKSNAALEGDVGNIEMILGANEPITVTTSFTDDQNGTKTHHNTYQFKAANAATQYALGNIDGTYSINIERLGDIDWDEGAQVSFRYNPTTKEITEKAIVHYWSGLGSYNNMASYGLQAPDHAGLQMNIDLKSFNLTTGEISLTATASGNGDYSNAINWGAPNPGLPYNTKLSFTGKVKVYPYQAP